MPPWAVAANGSRTGRGRHPVKTRVRSTAIVELEVLADRYSRFRDRVVRLEVDLLVLHRFPQPLHEHVVAPGALAIHADADAVVPEQTRERLTRKLAALVGVEDVRCAVALDRFLDRLDAEVGLHRDRDSVGQHPAGVPVDHGREIHEALAHRDIGDIHGPDLVGPGNREMAQQVWIDRVAGMFAARVGFAVEGLDDHFAHQGRHVLAPDVDAVLTQQIAQHAGSGERALQMQFVDATHECEVGLAHGLRQVVHAPAADVENLGLTDHRQRVGAVDHRTNPLW